MRSLFWKIFSWFWLVQLLISLVMFMLTNALRSSQERNDWRRAVGSGLRVQARAIALVHEHGGVPAVKEELQQWRRGSNSEVFVFDAQGQEITGLRAPDEARQVALQAARTRRIEVSSDPESRLSARAAPLAAGSNLVLVIANRPRNPSPIARDLRNPSPLGNVRMMALLLLSGIVCYGLASYLTSPTVKLRRATQQLASGDLTARVGAQMGRRRDELADLGRDFDQMAERIESLMLSERRLLADISHELRSPLARLTVALDLAEGRTDDQTQSYLDRIRREAERLNDLIGQVLSLSRLESGSAKVQPSSVNLSQLLRDVAQDADFEAQSRDCTVKVLGNDDCTTSGDATLLRSAVENVVRNAVRYTAPHTAVELTLKCLGGEKEREALVTVRDHGPGVPEETLSKLFRPFYRVADARDRESGGTGLGLAIAERAVRIHGGSVIAKNIEGGGLQIEIRLPLRSSPPKAST